MLKFTRVKEDWAMAIIREEYQEAKRRLHPRLSGWHFSAVKFLWTEGRYKKHVGTCWWFSKRIAMSYKFREHQEGFGEEDFRLCLRHELAHLGNQRSGHGGQFLRFLELLKGQRYHGQAAYERER